MEGYMYWCFYEETAQDKPYTFLGLIQDFFNSFLGGRGGGLPLAHT